MDASLSECAATAKRDPKTIHTLNVKDKNNKDETI